MVVIVEDDRRYALRNHDHEDNGGVTAVYKNKVDLTYVIRVYEIKRHNRDKGSKGHREELVYQ